MDLTSARYNNQLALFILAAVALLTWKLAGAAAQTGNWPGFFYSELHIAIAAAGAQFGLRQKP